MTEQQQDQLRKALVAIANHAEDKWARTVARRALAETVAFGEKRAVTPRSLLQQPEHEEVDPS